MKAWHSSTGNIQSATTSRWPRKSGYREQTTNTRRPDIVLYINGMAMVVLELKRASVEVGEAIRQLISNQDPLFHPGFFSTVQLLLAGNDSQGLRYGTTGTQEKYYLQWKDEHPDSDDARKPGATLDRPLTQLCSKARLLDIIHHFVIFDGGVKKVPRQHQYQGIKAAQERIGQSKGGVIWHTQGSGKSILMVLLAKWLLEQDAQARILIVTDRDELDRQIEGVMRNAGVLGSSSPSPPHHLPRRAGSQAGSPIAASVVRTHPQVRHVRPARPAAQHAGQLLCAGG